MACRTTDWIFYWRQSLQDSVYNLIGGRAVEVIAGFGLAFAVFPRLSALALFVFLVPATFVPHSFWLAAGTPQF